MNEIDVDIASNLTPFEEKVLGLIDSIRQKRTPSTVVRVVGGWVRDKMLNQPSDDIDLMVDNMSGERFAHIMAEELGLKGPAVIKENPEKTKNIETATMTIPVDGQDVELDFAQCRTETYGANRREVITKPATAEEDAMRRDLTIGALFYNINDRKVEDFTGKGLKDLITGTIRTPYDDGRGEVTPEAVNEVKQTFIEDPLRIFRAIRFAAKYNGDISPVTKAALSDPEVINATFFSERKIAEDRIMKELKKTFKGQNPEIAVSLLKETGLFQTILDQALKGTKYEGQMEQLDMEQNNPHHDLTVWGHTEQVIKNLLQHFPYEDEKRIIMILAALTHDLGKLFRKVHAESKSFPGRTSYIGHEKESKEITEHLLRFLKFENNIVNQVAGIARYHMQPHNLGRTEGAMGALRKFIRRMGEKSLSWLDVFNLSVADAYSKGLEVNPETIQKYNAFRDKLEQALASMKVQDDSTKIQPVLNGHDIMSILGIKPGPHMSAITDYLKNLMDESPDITPEEATIKLNELKAEAEKVTQTNPELPYEEAIVMVLQQPLTASGSNGKIVEASTCPQHLFKKKYGDVQELIRNNKYQEAMSTIKEFHKDYKEDEKVARMVIISLFNILSKEPKLRDNDLLQYALDRTEHSMFDPVLTSYATGLLVLLKTVTEPDAIMQLGKSMVDLNPGMLRTVLDSLPKVVHHDEIRQKLKAAVNEDL
jgi:tRNA nucleotidyltransferase/poly(A) polymerase